MILIFQKFCNFLLFSIIYDTVPYLGMVSHLQWS